MKRLILVKLLVLLLLFSAIGCTLVEERYVGQPERLHADLVLAGEILGKTLPVALKMMGRDIPPDYSKVVMDTVPGPDGKPMNKDVFPEWRLYHFNGFDTLVEVGGPNDGLILAVVPIGEKK